MDQPGNTFPPPAGGTADTSPTTPLPGADAARRLRALEHAMRTPLSSLVVAADLIDTATDLPTRLEARRVMTRQVDHARALLEEVRVLAEEIEKIPGPRRVTAGGGG